MTCPREPVVAEPPDPRQILTDNFDLIRQIVRGVARRARLDAATTEDLESAVWVHLLDRDSRVIRQFGGRSTLRTFLTVVVARLALDQRCAELGRWRPSRRARRLGRDAMRFETLVFRDGASRGEALATLAAERLELAPPVVRALMQGRSRPRRFVPVDTVADQLATAGDAAGVLDDVERRQRMRLVHLALRAALEALNPRDRRLLKLRHADGLKVSTMAARLGEDQKALYRRLSVLHLRLKNAIESGGLGVADTHDLAM
jgi:RNA polymerase sigma factor (sigma-70 family)